MRTVNQENYFELITGDVRKKPITSLEELKDKNLNVYVDYDKYFWQLGPVLDGFDTFDGLDSFKIFN